MLLSTGANRVVSDSRVRKVIIGSVYKMIDIITSVLYIVPVYSVTQVISASQVSLLKRRSEQVINWNKGGSALSAELHTVKDQVWCELWLELNFQKYLCGWKQVCAILLQKEGNWSRYLTWKISMHSGKTLLIQGKHWCLQSNKGNIKILLCRKGFLKHSSPTGKVGALHCSSKDRPHFHSSRYSVFQQKYFLYLKIKFNARRQCVILKTLLDFNQEFGHCVWLLFGFAWFALKTVLGSSSWITITATSVCILYRTLVYIWTAWMVHCGSS